MSSAAYVAPVAGSPESAAASAGPGTTLAGPMPSSVVGPDRAAGAVTVFPTASTYRAVQASRPRALGHIAWTDRWLSRFAGASGTTLAGLDAVTAGKADQATALLGSLATSAPAPLYIAALSDRAGASAAARAEASPSRPGSATSVPVTAPILPAAPSSAAAPAVAPTGDAAPVSRTPASASRIPESAPRIDDDESVSDEMFAAIAAARVQRSSRAASRTTTPARSTPEAGSPTVGGAEVESRPAASAAPVIESSARRTGERLVIDRLLELGPIVPDAGMRSALAASPAAPALRPLLPLPATRAFDVRSMFGDQLAQAYLAGVIEPPVSGRSLGGIGLGGVGFETMSSIPGLAADFVAAGLVDGAAGPGAIGPDGARLAALAARAPGAELVAPTAGRRPDSSSAAVAATMDDRRAVAEQAAEILAAEQGGPAVERPVRDIPAASSSDAAVVAASAAGLLAGPAVTAMLGGRLLPTEAERITQVAALTSASPSERSWALAVQAGVLDPDGGPAESSPAPEITRGMAGGSGEMAFSSRARAFEPDLVYGPGRTALRAEAWSVEHERGAADLSFDFVTPELVLAARAYGLSPVDAARAARLSIAGTAGLTSLASAVDLTFVEAFARSPQARAAQASQVNQASQAGMYAGWRQAGIGAGNLSGIPMSASAASPEQPSSVGSDVPASFDTAQGTAFDSSGVPGGTPGVGEMTAGAVGARASTLAGLAGPGAALPGDGAGDRARRPRGAFLWPRAAMSLLDIASPSGLDSGPGRSLSLAALDLLAAKAVADVGIFVAPDGTPLSAGEILAGTTGQASGGQVSGEAPVSSAGDGRYHTGAASAASDGASPSSGLVGSGESHDSGQPEYGAEWAGALPGDLPVVQGLPGAESDASLSDASPSSGSGTGDGILSALSNRGALPTQFAAIYATLASSPAGRSMSPAVRAARALALANSSGQRQGRATPSQMRAAAAWAVMPMVIPGELPAASLDGELSIPSDGPSYGASYGEWVGQVSGVPAGEQGDPRGERSGAVFVQPGSPEARRAGAGSSRSDVATAEWVAPAQVRQLASRAGESLQSYVSAPERSGGEWASSSSSSAAESSGAAGAIRRVPSAAQTMVETGSTMSSAVVQQMIQAARKQRSAGDQGIPDWFENAAKHMFEESSGGGISLAEMTLISSAPASHIAASPRTASASAPEARPQAAEAGSETEGAKPTDEIEEIAQKVYREICQMMRLAEMRNKGRPFS